MTEAAKAAKCSECGGTHPHYDALMREAQAPALRERLARAIYERAFDDSWDAVFSGTAERKLWLAVADAAIAVLPSLAGESSTPVANCTCPHPGCLRHKEVRAELAKTVWEALTKIYGPGVWQTSGPAVCAVDEAILLRFPEIGQGTGESAPPLDAVAEAKRLGPIATLDHKGELEAKYIGAVSDLIHRARAAGESALAQERDAQSSDAMFEWSKGSAKWDGRREAEKWLVKNVGKYENLSEKLAAFAAYKVADQHRYFTDELSKRDKGLAAVALWREGLLAARHMLGRNILAINAMKADDALRELDALLERGPVEGAENDN